MTGLSGLWAQQGDEICFIFPTAFRPTPDGSGLHAPLHAWVFEPETTSHNRAAFIDKARSWLVDAPSTPEKKTFMLRAWPFVVDNERSKMVVARVASTSVTVGHTAPNGHIDGVLQLDSHALATGGAQETLAVALRAGRIELELTVPRLPATGTLVISDVDDTLRESNVLDKRALMRSTFVEPFRAVAGMPEWLRNRAGEGAAIHFVSAAPWQLAWPLVRFLREQRVPVHGLDMRPFRLKDSSGWHVLFEESADYKLARIRSALAAWPARSVVLVGDSGEHDPEVYGTIAREFPNRIALIAIRRVAGSDLTEARMSQAFRDLQPNQWVLFDSPTQIPHRSPSP